MVNFLIQKVNYSNIYNTKNLVYRFDKTICNKILNLIMRKIYDTKKLHSQKK